MSLQLTPQDLKGAVATALNDLLASIQSAYNDSPEWQKAAKEAYPAEGSATLKDKPKKQKKDKGTRYPGAANANVEARADGSVDGQDREQVEIASNASAAMAELRVEQNMVNGN